MSRIIVLGAGIGGLSAAIALAGEGHEVTVIDRDPPPPELSANAAFDEWQRRGVGQLRHSHAFLARLYQLIRENHPALLADLLEAGCRELKFADTVPMPLVPSYVPAKGDEHLTILSSRRTTLELIMRRYAARQPDVTFRTDEVVEGLIAEKNADGQAVIHGVTLRSGEKVTGDLVVDAMGRLNPGAGWLKELGVHIREEDAPAGIVYFTRHYHIKNGMSEPERTAAPGAADLGFLKFGVFPGDNGCFSITLAVPEVERTLSKAILDTEVFDKVCRSIPGLAPWLEEERTEPRSKVFLMGNLFSRWRHMTEAGKPHVLNYFPLGDCHIRTNPLYGRGCSFAAIQAHILRDVLRAEDDPIKRAIAYHAATREEIRPYYDNMVKQDLGAIKRARNELTPGYKPSFKARLIKRFTEDGINIAIRSDIQLYRAFMQGFHMLAHPTAWLLENKKNLAKVLWVWARGRRWNRKYYPPRTGPERTTLFNMLGLPKDADLITDQA
jgi:2-polyprenyl-6-methoxyphenol hydroxylase-like FAD-dependent oxidoreductase